MRIASLARLLATATLLAGASASVAMAQTSPPEPKPNTPPAATAPKEPAAPSTERTDKSPGKPGDLMGLTVLSSDGNRLGSVQKVAAQPDGKVMAIHIKTGGFLGFGGKIVAIPDGRFARKGDTVQLTMTAEEVSKLPEVKEQS